MAQQAAARPVRTSAYFRRLVSRPDLFTVPGAEALSEPSIELMRVVITTHLDAAELGKDALKATLPLRILESARAHLHDPHLGAAQVAAAHHISERHLYNILGASGITLADWIRKQRLERCRNDIAASALSRHQDRIDRTRMGIHRPLKLYPHVQKRLRHVATRVAPPSQHSAIRAHGRVHQSVVLIACTPLCRGRTVG
jgi:AraC-like DNA-binding protein